MKTFITFFFCSFVSFVFSQNKEQACAIVAKINDIIQTKHYRPKKVDDSLSIYVYDNLLQKLDNSNSLFLATEVAILNKHRLRIDDYILEKNCFFLEDILKIYTNAVYRYKSNIESIAKEPFAESSLETIKFSKLNFPFHATEPKLKLFHKKRLLYEFLKEVSLTSLSKDSILADKNNIYKKTKLKVFEENICNAEKLLLEPDDFFTIFYNVFCSYFDPHSSYFSKSQKTDFLSAVSSDNLSFGMLLSMNEKQELFVSQILPGSSAYFSDKIEIGDVLTSIKTDKDTFEINCTNLKSTNKVLNSSEFKNADFGLRKKSGENYTVSLSKKITKNYGNSVYSFVLEQDNIKSGYINIPSFYDTFENGKSSVTEDLTKEIYKLKQEKITSLILDLQNNGGGSMNEAIKMCGLFIDAGPVAIMDNNLNKKNTLKDMNRGIAFDGDLIILINGLSASASEFFANAMQDYNRAIIIGNHSLGKATMQSIFPLDDKNEEFVKVTLEKFYRITGKSSQFTGITPDIQVATLYESQMPKERDFSTALKNDSVVPIVKYATLANPRFMQIVSNSKKRIVSWNINSKIQEANLKINKFYEEQQAPLKLNFEAIFSYVSEFNKLIKEVEIISEFENKLVVKRNAIDIEYQEFDDYLKKNNIVKIKLLKSNNAVYEAVQVINELKSN